MRLLDELGGYCEYLSQDQYVPQRKWTRQMLFGIISSKSLMLSEIGRSLRERKSLHQTEKRLSRNLNSDRLDDDALLRRHLERCARMAKANDGKNVVVSVDYTDISKPYARPDDGGMELACRCWDGSQKKIGMGYPVIQVEAHCGGSVQFPLVLRPFSFNEPGFRSQTFSFIDAIREAAPYVGADAWWTFDRGFDGSPMFDALDSLPHRPPARIPSAHLPGSRLGSLRSQVHP